MSEQLDLFAPESNLGVKLQSDLIEAIRQRNPATIREARDILEARFPDDALLPAASLLQAALLAAPAGETHDAAAAQIEHLESVITPAAQAALGTGARAWLAPLWQAQARHWAHLGFARQWPTAHSAPLWLRAHQWASARQSITTLSPDWRDNPVALGWMVQALHGEAGTDSQDLWVCLIELAWRDTQCFSETARRIDLPALQRLLKPFEARFASARNSHAWFPAWLVQEHPAATARLIERSRPCGDTPPEAAARLIVRILDVERRADKTLLARLRAQLRERNADLFELHMQSRR